MERVFDAPAERIFNAYVDPEQVPHWFGPAMLTTTVDHIDPRLGGTWRFVLHAADGGEYGFRGEFREIDRPTRLVSTFEFEGMPGQVKVDSLTLDKRDGKTRATAVSRFESKEERDDGLSDGDMESGARESWNRLAALVEGGAE